MVWKAREWARDRDDVRDLRKPETLLAADSVSSFLGRLPEGSDVLDVGGRLATRLQPESLSVTLSSEPITLPGEGEGPIPEEHRIRLDQKDESFRGVVVPTLFFFLPKPAARNLVAELFRVLRPGGLGFAAFPPLWNPSLVEEALIDAASPEGPDADIVRRGGVSVRYTRYTTREIDALLADGVSPQLTTQKNGVRRIVFRRR